MSLKNYLSFNINILKLKYPHPINKFFWNDDEVGCTCEVRACRKKCVDDFKALQCN